jgi:hypothetical protein
MNSSDDVSPHGAVFLQYRSPDDVECARCCREGRISQRGPNQDRFRNMASMGYSD